MVCENACVCVHVFRIEASDTIPISSKKEVKQISSLKMIGAITLILMFLNTVENFKKIDNITSLMCNKI